MSKRFLLVLGFVVTLTAVTYANANPTVYTDDIGRMHFMGKEAGYSGMPAKRMQEAQASAINNTANEISRQQNETAKQTEKTLEEVNKTVETTTKSSHKMIYTSTKQPIDASNPRGYGATNIQGGVNESKTMYTDGIGRLHFFGKDNKF